MTLPPLHATIGNLDRRHSGLVWTAFSLGFLSLAAIAFFTLLAFHTALGALGLTTQDVKAAWRGHDSTPLWPRGGLRCSQVLVGFVRFISGRGVHSVSGSVCGGTGPQPCLSSARLAHVLDTACDNSYCSCC